jgi:ATP/maltotriose-dependent transcriptional regulator MalT
VDDALVALSSLLDDLIDHIRGSQHMAEIDLTITSTNDALHVKATSLRERSVAPARQPLTLLLTPLTAAEKRVLAHLPTNLTFAAIAEECFLSRNTVKTQAIAIYRKLGVSSRHDAVTRARELGLLPAFQPLLSGSPDGRISALAGPDRA